MRSLAATLIVTGTLTILLATPAPATGALDCPNGFGWGGQCWNRTEGAAFARWLRAHGTTPKAFKKAHPELAATFKQPWPPKPPFWRTCHEGLACARAVLPHYFQNVGYALQIVACETGHTYDAETLGAAGERGWWQIHPVHFGWLDENRLWDVRYNSAIARRLSSGGTNFGPWTCA